MIIVFFIDTSVSMNQKAINQASFAGMTLLDIAKCGVEQFIKTRRERPEGRNDKYWLVTTDAGPTALKVGPKESPASVKDYLKCLVAHSYTALGETLKTVFEVLNQGRLLHPKEVSGLDRHRYGWCPASIEPAAIILLTDGGMPTSDKGVADQLDIPPLSLAESALVELPFHWDQRLFSYEIRPPFPALDPVSQNDMMIPRPGLKVQCQATGGDAHVAINLKHLNCHMEQLASRLGHGVVLNLTVEIPSSLEDSITADKLAEKRVLISPVAPEAACHWPIPEDYHVDASLEKTPQRKPHPCVVLRRSRDFDGVVPPFLVHDVYALQPCAFTEVLCKKFRTEVWKAYVAPREGDGEQETFGFVKVAPDGAAVYLYVLPYNYPELIALLASCGEGSPKAVTKTARWRNEFDSYVRSVPVYYIAPLRQALRDKRLQLHEFVPSDIDTEPSQALRDYFKGLKKQAKAEVETWQAQRQSLMTAAVQAAPKNRAPLMQTPSDVRLFDSNATGIGFADFRDVLQSDLKDMTSAAAFSLVDDPSNGKRSAADPGTLDLSQEVFLCNNPFDIDRASLLRQLDRMRVHAHSVARVPGATGMEVQQRPTPANFELFADSVAMELDEADETASLATSTGPGKRFGTGSTYSSADSLECELEDAERRKAKFQRLLRRHRHAFDLTVEENAKHRKTVNAMGNYLVVLQKKHENPALRDLRDPLSDDDGEEHFVVNFGSRYKEAKSRKKKRPADDISSGLSVDEADVSEELLRVKQPGSPEVSGGEKAHKKQKSPPQSPRDQPLVPEDERPPTHGPKTSLAAGSTSSSAPDAEPTHTPLNAEGAVPNEAVPTQGTVPSEETSALQHSGDASTGPLKPNTSPRLLPFDLVEDFPLALRPGVQDVPVANLSALKDYLGTNNFVRHHEPLRFRIRRLLATDPRQIEGQQLVDILKGLQGPRTYRESYLHMVAADIKAAKLSGACTARLLTELTSLMQVHKTV